MNVLKPMLVRFVVELLDLCACPKVKLLNTHFDILIPRGRDPSGQHQGSRPLAGPDFLSMHKIFVLYFQPIRFARFDNKSMNRGLPVFEPAGSLDRWC